MRTRAVLLLALVHGVAYADVTVDKATAEALFMRAKQLDKAGDAAAACPLYEGSYRADPQLGALLNLANCHEQIGKLATAWAEFREATEIARRRGDARTDYARRRADELAPRVSWLAIHAVTTPGTTITRDALDVTQIVGQELPIDPGTYVISATAPQREPWSTTVTITTPGTHAVVDIPALVDVAPVTPLAPKESAAPGVPDSAAAVTKIESAPATTSVARTDVPRGSSRWPFVVGGAGIVMVATGLGFGAHAYSQWNESRDVSLCDTRNVCNADGERLIASARRSATLGTYFVVGGGVIVATSVAWWALTRSRAASRLEVAPQVTSTVVGIVASGRF